MSRPKLPLKVFVYEFIDVGEYSTEAYVVSAYTMKKADKFLRGQPSTANLHKRKYKVKEFNEPGIIYEHIY